VDQLSVLPPAVILAPPRSTLAFSAMPYRVCPEFVPFPFLPRTGGPLSDSSSQQVVFASAASYGSAKKMIPRKKLSPLSDEAGVADLVARGTSPGATSSIS